MLKEFFFVLFHPSYWYQIYPYNEYWDAYCKSLLNSGNQFTNITLYRATLNNKSIWIENHPYASFTIGKGQFRVRPSRYTIYKLHQRLISSIINNNVD